MDDLRAAKLTILAPLFLVIGLVCAAKVFPRALEVRDLDGLDARTESSGGECGPFTGGFVDIEVEGRRYTCTVGDKCGSRGVAVAYDSDDPSRCRAVEDLGHLGQYEWGLVVVPFVFVTCGILGIVYTTLRRRRKAAEIQAIVDGDEP